MNIIYEIGKNNLRLTNFNSKATYQLENLIFYIPIECREATPFLLIADSKKNKHILKLSNIHNERAYKVYSVSLENSFDIEEGCADIAIILIKDQVITSARAIINLKYDNLISANYISVLEKLSQEVQQKYALIEKMTKMNIDIYQAFEKEVNKQ